MKVAIGQDSHRFDFENSTGKPLILGGVVFENAPPLLANSDGDVVLHAITRAVSGVTTVDIIGPRADQLVREGITDSAVYLREALESLKGKVSHLSLSIECKTPKLQSRIPELRKSLAELLHTAEENVGVTAHSGEGLTDCGKGLGISVTAVLTVE